MFAISGAAMESGFAPRELLMETYFHRRRVILDDEAIGLMLSEEDQALGATIEEFPDRAKKFALMANIATMHGMADWRKDLPSQCCDEPARL